MDIDLNALSLRELKDLQARLNRAISSYEERRKKEALSELEDRARSMGYSLAELTGTPVVRKRSVSAAKYANPANPAETWTGRGRKPRWYEAAIAAGKSPDDLAI